jgi:hypothetical protein
MSDFNKIVEEERERQRLEDERRKLEDAAFAVVMRLSRESQRALLVRLIDAQEATSTPKPKAKPSSDNGPKPPKATPETKGDGKATFVDSAEAFVLLHPEGVSTRQVADAIGQKISAVDGTLRQLLKRGTVERRGRQWFPKGAPVAVKPKKPGIREDILAVYKADRGPLSAAAIFRGVQKIKPDANKASVDGEIHRMKHATKPLLVQAGVGENNGGLYALTAEGEALLTTI